jgi:hypothetical protein
LGEAVDVLKRVWSIASIALLSMLVPSGSVRAEGGFAADGGGIE